MIRAVRSWYRRTFKPMPPVSCTILMGVTLGVALGKTVDQAIEGSRRRQQARYDRWLAGY